MKDLKCIDLIQDPSFETGFHVLGINPVEDHRNYSIHLDYQRKAKKSNHVIWQMAQWWTEFPLKGATYQHDKGIHQYKTASRVIKIVPDQKKLIFELNSQKDFIAGKRNSHTQPWSHLLIEQDFKEAVSLLELEALEVNLTFKIHQCVNLNGEDYNPELHAAQLLWYLVIHDQQTEDQKYYGSARDFFWFGIPLFDSRKTFCQENRHVDEGGIGTTQKLIYSMSNQNYLTEPIQMGKTYQITYDILPEVKKAYAYAREHYYMKRNEKPNLQIGYMNFGWECPGAYKVQSEFSNMQIKAFKKSS